MGFPGGSDGKESACDAGDPGSVPGLGRSPGGQPTSVFLPGEFHGQRSLEGYSPRGHKELDTIEQLTLTFRHPVLKAQVSSDTMPTSPSRGEQQLQRGQRVGW